MTYFEELDEFVMERGVKVPADHELIVRDVLDSYREQIMAGNPCPVLSPETVRATALNDNYTDCLVLLQKEHGLTLRTRPVNPEATHWITYIAPWTEKSAGPNLGRRAEDRQNSNLQFVMPHVESIYSGEIVG